MSQKRDNNTDMATGWRIEQANDSDSDELLRFMLGDFLSTEPLNECLELGEQDATEFFRGLIKAGLAEPATSHVARDNQSGEIVGICLSTILRRADHHDSATTFEVDECLPIKVRTISKFLCALENKIWELVPADINCTVSWLVISVDQLYKRRGIANALLTYNIADLKERYGCQGAVTEASAYNSQQLFRKLGYQPLHEITHAEWRDERGAQIFNCKDSPRTDRATLEFLRF